MICQSSTGDVFKQLLGVFQREGIIIQRLYENGYPYGASNSFPDIAYALLVNWRFGVGELIGNNSVDIDQDGGVFQVLPGQRFLLGWVITERINVRQFLFEQAAYQMLDFTIIGGRFSLSPSLPMAATSRF